MHDDHEARIHALEFSTIQMRGELDLNKGAVNWLMKQSGWPGSTGRDGGHPDYEPRTDPVQSLIRDIVREEQRDLNEDNDGRLHAIEVELGGVVSSLRAQRDNAIRRAEDAEASEAALRERLMSPEKDVVPTGAGADALLLMGWTYTSATGWTAPKEPAKLVAVRQTPTGTEYHRMQGDLAACRELLKLRTDRLVVVEGERDAAQRQLTESLRIRDELRKERDEALAVAGELMGQRADDRKQWEGK